MDLFSTLQLLHEAVMSVLVTTIYGRWCGTITYMMNQVMFEEPFLINQVVTFLTTIFVLKMFAYMPVQVLRPSVSLFASSRKTPVFSGLAV